MDSESGYDIAAADDPGKELDRRLSSIRKKRAKLCDLSYVENVLKYARSLLPTRIQDMDAKPLLFKCRNYTIDLRTGKHRAHWPDDMITRQSGVIFDPEATCPKWDLFIRTIFDKKPELYTFLQQALGYCLCGETDTDLLVFCYGSGRNGKSTLFEVVGKILGDYFTTLPIEAILDQGRGARDPIQQYEILSLKGTRLALSTEIPQGRRLNEAMVKHLIGGDQIVARAPFQLPVSFRPTHKIFICGNHQPIIEGSDDGIWRRVCLLPFEYQFPASGVEYKPRGQVVSELMAEAPGILNWLLAGFRDLKKAGRLIPPNRVLDATKDYREESDILGLFVRNRCIFDTEARIPSSAIYRAYRNWCEESGEQPILQRALIQSLRQTYRLDPIRSSTARGLKGIRLRNLADDNPENGSAAAQAKA